MKKIDTEKSTIFGDNEDDSNKLKLGIRGYFCHYSDFENYVEGELEGFTYSEYMTTEEDPDGDYGNQWYDYFIPEDKVVFKEEEKEKKLRPFKSLEEFFNVTAFKVGDIVQIKKLGNLNFEETAIITSIRLYIDGEYQRIEIYFGSVARPFVVLFEYYKYFKNGEWLPFGVEE